MRKLLALSLASAMVMSMASGILAATPTYSVGAIDSTPYAYDKDKAAVDLTNPNPGFSYGDTLYYPLLSDKSVGSSAAIETARKELADAQSALTTAEAILNSAKTDAAAKAADVTAAEAMVVKAKAVSDAAIAWKTAADASSADVAVKEAAYKAALTAFNNTLTPDAVAADAVTSAGLLLTDANTSVTTAQGIKATADALVVTEQGNVTAATAIVTGKQTALDTLLSSNFRYVYEYDAVKGIKIKQTWDMNGKTVSGVDIVKKKAHSLSNLEQKFIYFVAINLKEATTTSSTDINGVISLRKSGEFDYEERQLEVAIEVQYGSAAQGVITDKVQLFSEGNGFSGDIDDELRFEVDEDSYFTVNTTGQGKLLLAMNTKFDNEIAARFPDANLDFYNGNGASFNKTGEMTLSADEGSFIYKVNKDGSLNVIKAVYNESEEAYQFKTRSLDRYVISDKELKNTGSVVTPDVDGSTGGNTGGGTNNPNTGASV